jgi:hypothetical protein
MNEKNRKDFDRWIKSMTMKELRILMIININRKGLSQTFYQIAIGEYLKRIGEHNEQL